MNRTAALLATFFGVGYTPKLPGTAASLAAFACWAGLSALLPAWAVALFLAHVAPFLFSATHVYLKTKSERDPGEIVADEVLGSGVAVLFLPLSWTAFVMAFVLFRLLDVLKPPPIRSLERAGGAWGVVLDDLAAGILANLLTRAALHWIF
ncbi:MAG: phosphatidylglycerophosphatase A [Acidobacteriota bacterium]|nr:MAG: phosphatidylglycerophosphatase A [Acidobacteriota bacterium]